MPAVMIYVQHLLGIGHLMRARLIAEALADAGFDVHLVTGGMPIGGRMPRGVRIVQLPPIRVSDASFMPLRDGEFVPIDDAYRDVAARPAARDLRCREARRRDLRDVSVRAPVAALRAHAAARAHRGDASAAARHRLGARDPADAAQGRARARDARLGEDLVRRDSRARRPALRAIRGDVSAAARARAAGALHGLRA